MDRLCTMIENLLPVALSKLIFIVSPLLSISLYKGFLDLPSSWLPTPEPERYLLRLLLSGLMLLFGSVSLLALLMYHNRKINLDLLKAKAKNISYDSLQRDFNDLKKFFQDLTRTSDDQASKIKEQSNHIIGLRDELNRMSNSYSESIHKLKKAETDYVDLQQGYDTVDQKYSEEIARLKQEHQEEIASLHESYKKPPEPPVSIAGWT